MKNLNDFEKMCLYTRHEDGEDFLREMEEMTDEQLESVFSELLYDLSKYSDKGNIEEVHSFYENVYNNLYAQYYEMQKGVEELHGRFKIEK